MFGIHQNVYSYYLWDVNKYLFCSIFLYICRADVNECETPGGQVCAPNTQCDNTLGSFRCLCQAGFEIEHDTNYCKGFHFYFDYKIV